MPPGGWAPLIGGRRAVWARDAMAYVALGPIGHGAVSGSLRQEAAHVSTPGDTARSGARNSAG